MSSNVETNVRPDPDQELVDIATYVDDVAIWGIARSGDAIAASMKTINVLFRMMNSPLCYCQPFPSMSSVNSISGPPYAPL